MMMKMMVERKGNVRTYRVYDLGTVEKIIADRDAVTIGSRIVVLKGNKVVFDRIAE